MTYVHIHDIQVVKTWFRHYTSGGLILMTLYLRFSYLVLDHHVKEICVNLDRYKQTFNKVNGEDVKEMKTRPIFINYKCRDVVRRKHARLSP